MELCRNTRQRQKRVCGVLLLLAAINFLIYGKVKEGRFLPSLMQSSLVANDIDVYKVTLLRMTSQKNKTYFIPTLVPGKAWVKYDTWRGFQLPIITCRPMGRLGNLIGEYATLYALHRIYNATVLLHPDMRMRLEPIFPNLTIPNVPDYSAIDEWKKLHFTGSLYNYSSIELAASGALGPRRFEIVSFPFEIQLFHPFKEEILKELRFSEKITSKVQDYLWNITETWKVRTQQSPVFIGFHVRRTDYVGHAKRMFGANLPSVQYFKRAMNYYRQKFGNSSVFVAASDDMKFLRLKIGTEKDVFFASAGESANGDLALLAACNHSIMTMGSFGFWTGYLTGGEVVYPDVKTTKIYRFSRFMFERSRLSFTPLPVS